MLKLEYRRRQHKKRKLKKRRLEYLKKLQNKILNYGYNILKNIKVFYIIRNKRKKVLEISLANKAKLWLLKKAKRKQTKKCYRNDVVKMER